MLSADRDQVMQAIQAENVGVGVHFRAVHLQPYYAETFGFQRGDFPHAEYYSDRTISLPLYPRMTDRDADDVIEAVRTVIARFRR
jgi:dTDP-4-amino-4,6-dideoxygalactose transaminase